MKKFITNTIKGTLLVIAVVSAVWTFCLIAWWIDRHIPQATPYISAGLIIVIVGAVAGQAVWGEVKTYGGRYLP